MVSALELVVAADLAKTTTTVNTTTTAALEDSNTLAHLLLLSEIGRGGHRARARPLRLSLHREVVLDDKDSFVWPAQQTYHALRSFS